MLTLTALVISALLVFGTTTFHYEMVRLLDRFTRLRARGPYPTLYVVIAGLVTTHLLEIGLYALMFVLAEGPLGLGEFHGARLMGPMDYFYFAAEAYASLGYGDIYPTGGLRLVASVAPLNGILLLSWSGSFLFSLVQDWRRDVD